MQTFHRRSPALAAAILLLGLALPLLILPAAAQDQGIIIFGVDDDPENMLWECETNRAGFGEEGDNLLRCFSFHYEVPPEGITSAVLHVELNPVGEEQATDSTQVAVGEPFEDCAWAQGAMLGCITLHGGFNGDETFLNLDLFDIACDETANGSPEKQAALVRQLDAGALHFMIQDDTIVHRAVLVLNAGATPANCGTTSDPTIPGSEAVQSAAEKVAGTIVISPADVRIDERTASEIPIYVEGADGIVAIQVEILYDPAILDYLEMRTGSLLPESANLEIRLVSPGRISASFTSADELSGSGELFVPVFIAGGGAEAATVGLNGVSARDAEGTDVLIEARTGSITIAADSGFPVWLAFVIAFLLAAFLIVIVAIVLLIRRAIHGQQPTAPPPVITRPPSPAPAPQAAVPAPSPAEPSTTIMPRSEDPDQGAQETTAQDVDQTQEIPRPPTPAQTPLSPANVIETQEIVPPGQQSQLDDSQAISCPNCGESNAPGSAYCATCGQRLQ